MKFIIEHFEQFIHETSFNISTDRRNVGLIQFIASAFDQSLLTVVHHQQLRNCQQPQQPLGC
jgi:hypothetical protein